jgi:hypothetical protein
MENNEKQHLELIAEMINTARKEYSDTSFIYLTWGWAVCVASLTQYVLLQMKSEYNGIAWAILMPLAAIVNIVGSVRRKKTERVKNHLDRTMGYVWRAVGITLGLVLFSANNLQLNTYPVLILLYGIGTYISGGLMELKPMIAGGICCAVIGFVAFYLKFEYQLLLLALSVIVSYIIPGYILKNRFRQNV